MAHRLSRAGNDVCSPGLVAVKVDNRTVNLFRLLRFALPQRIGRAEALLENAELLVREAFCFGAELRQLLRARLRQSSVWRG